MKQEKLDDRGKRTPLQCIDLLQRLPLLLLPLLQLRDLHLLTELLEVALPAGLRGRLLRRGLLVQLLLDLVHVLVALDHLGEVVARPREGDALLLEEGAGVDGGDLADAVEGKLAVQVVVGVGHVDGLRRDERVVLGEGGLRGDEGDALDGGGDGGGVIDGEALVGDHVGAFVAGEVGEGDVFFFFAVVFLFTIFFFFVFFLRIASFFFVLVLIFVIFFVLVSILLRFLVTIII